MLTDDEIAREVERRRPFPCTVERGGIVVMRPLAVHASSKSQSSKPRRILHIEYASQALREKVSLAIA
ncbi:phytanoyl-CoA dioxygenase family protein [Candidatus Korobacter versatilis]|uniref:phytanoyl-CoA dioxygenase family protein n=1 Tax=Candidatus Korobacter versatilis TaxID=658062 RepID=UPI0038CBFA74